jgi:hypothetical protein
MIPSTTSIKRVSIPRSAAKGAARSARTSGSRGEWSFARSPARVWRTGSRITLTTHSAAPSTRRTNVNRTAEAREGAEAQEGGQARWEEEGRQDALSTKLTDAEKGWCDEEVDRGGVRAFAEGCADETSACPRDKVPHRGRIHGRARRGRRWGIGRTQPS